MSDLQQLSAQFGGPMSSGDTSTQMLGLMDDLANNFRSAMANAQDKQGRSEKLSAPQKKAPAKEEAKAERKEAKSEQRAEEKSESSEAAQQEGAAEAQLEELPSQPSENLEPTHAESVQEAKPSAEAEADAVSNSEAIELESSSAKLEEASQEAPLEDAQDSQDSIAEAAGQAAAPVEQKAEASKAESAEKPVTEAKPKEASKVEKLPQQKLQQAELPQEQQQKEVAKPEVKQAEPQAVKPEPSLRAQSSEETELTTDFHSIDAEAEGKASRILTPKDQANKVREGLQQIAAQTQVQSPKAEQVSQKVMDGLKAVNSQLAKSLEQVAKPAAPTTPAPSAVALPKAAVARSPQSIANQAAKSAERGQPSQDMGDRIEDMKSKVVDQIRHRVKMAIRGKVSEVKLHLKPKFLGTVKVQLQMEDSAIKASFVVDNQSVKDLLTRTQPNLQNALEEQGIELNDLEVQVAGDALDDGGNGKPFASLEDQKAVRQWLGSFQRFGEAADTEEVLEPVDQGPADDSNESLNVIV